MLALFYSPFSVCQLNNVWQGGDDGCLYEITYQGNEGWFGKSCRRVNHSQGTLSFLVPSFLHFSERDGISQLELDASRGLLYALTKRGSVRAYQLGNKPGEVSLLATISEVCIIQFR
jgi:nuclear pore complex protein Nup155